MGGKVLNVFYAQIYQCYASVAVKEEFYLELEAFQVWIDRSTKSSTDMLHPLFC